MLSLSPEARFDAGLVPEPPLPPFAYLRLLFARIGVLHDPETGERLIRQTLQQIVDHGRGHPVSGAGPGGAGAARAPTTPGDEH